MKTSPLRLPRRFFYDHAERDLPTPVVIRITPSYVFVDGNDPNIAELINDAEHYADDYGPYGGALLKKSAIATIRAYKKWCDDEHSRGEKEMTSPNITEEQAEIFGEFLDSLSKEEKKKYTRLYRARTLSRFEDYLIEFLAETDTTEVRRKLTGKMLPSYS